MQIALLETVAILPGAGLDPSSTPAGATASKAPDGLFAELLGALTGLVDTGEAVEVSEVAADDDTDGDDIDSLATVITGALPVNVPVSSEALLVQAKGEASEETLPSSGSTLADRILFARANLTALLDGAPVAVANEGETTPVAEAIALAPSSETSTPDTRSAAPKSGGSDGAAIAETSGPLVSVLSTKTATRDQPPPLTTEAADLVAVQDADSTASRTADFESPAATRSRSDALVEALVRSLLRSDRSDTTVTPDSPGGPNSVNDGPELPVVATLESRTDRGAFATDPLTDPGKAVQAMPQGLRDATVRSVQYLVAHGEQSIRVRLVPASLGELHVTVTTSEDGGVNVQLTSAHHAVREKLDGQLPALRDALARDGIDVGRITVSPHMGTDTGSTPSGDRQLAGQPWRFAAENREGYPETYRHDSRQRQFVHEGALDLLA